MVYKDQVIRSTQLKETYLCSIKKLLFTTAVTAVIIFITLIHKNVSVVL